MTINEIIEHIYPVGSCYISTSTSNPETFLSGKWERIEGEYLLKVGTGEIECTEGDNFIIPTNRLSSEYTNLSKTHCPNHSHQLKGIYTGYAGTKQYIITKSISGNYTSKMGSTYYNSSGNHRHSMEHTHEYLPLSLKIYLWKRVS